jgi:hypothetical protein
MKSCTDNGNRVKAAVKAAGNKAPAKKMPMKEMKQGYGKK